MRIKHVDIPQYVCVVQMFVDAALQSVETMLFGDLGYFQQQLDLYKEEALSKVPFLIDSLVRHGHVCILCRDNLG